MSILDDWLSGLPAGGALQALASLEPDAAVFAVDAEQRIVYWSPGGEALLGFKPEDVVGEHCLKANRCQTCIVGCGVREQGQLRDVPLTLYRPDGSPVLVSKSASAIRDADGGFLGGVEILRPRSGDTHPPPALLEDRAADFHGLVSHDPVMQRAFQTVRNVAETDATALVRGESGSGKEGVARAIHEESQRRGSPFVAVNCAALTPTLIESELFGHEQGAFTGAVRARDGLFVQADGGTLFLDEVAELPLEVQAKLLRVLEAGEVVPVGGNRPRKVDVRIVAATHKSLREQTQAGRFREDLLYRLRVVPIYLPPLRERRTDVEPLLWHFIEHFNRRGPRRVDSVAPGAMRALLSHTWPGNVRELRNVVEFAFAVGRDPELGLHELPPEVQEVQAQPTAGSQPGIGGVTVGGPAPRPGPTSKWTPPQGLSEREAIEQALRATGGHVGQAAERLGISRPTLWRRRKKWGL